ncbi:MAG: exosome complex RNA-binding protein Rrp4 [Candidatus Pacearchaeota archaeon]
MTEHEEHSRKIVIPGEVIVSGNDYLPGEGTAKKGNDIVAYRYGLAEEVARLVKVIPLSGVYQPRRGNVVIGKIINITFNGWLLDIGCPDNSFLSVAEFPKFVHKNELDTVMNIGDIAVAKIKDVNRKAIDLTMRLKGLGKIDEGIIMRVNPNKVPRIIGKEGSMITLIKDETGCNITVGQNGFIWIKGDSVEKELFAKKAVSFIAERSLVHGLTEEVKKWFGKEKK